MNLSDKSKPGAKLAQARHVAGARPFPATTTVGGTDPTTYRVELTRTASASTADQALWIAIRSSTNATNFNLYSAYLERVFCEKQLPGKGPVPGKEPAASLFGALTAAKPTGYSYLGVDAYNLLKKATEAFLLVHCGVAIRNEHGTAYPLPTGGDEVAIAEGDAVKDVEGNDESSRVGSAVTYGEASTALSSYLSASGTLPYLDRILVALFGTTTTQVNDVSATGPDACEGHPLCADLLQKRWTCPSLIELLWSFWHDEAGLVQTINAVALRFQNRRAPGLRDPLAHLKLDPLRPLNNLLWGYIQDEINRLTLARRAYEYAQHYGLALIGKAIPQMNTVENRSKFVEAFNNLLSAAARFYKEDDDTTIVADAFPVLNALKDVHMHLAQGAVNQFGDLPWTSRVEMLIQKWLLARPEIREYLGGNPMVAYSEPWMAQVETMKTLQGWSDVPVNHFRDLGVFGEQILLSVRYGDWANVHSTDQAGNWARYWRSEIQSYIHSYRAVTGVDLSSDVVDSRSAAVRYLQPAVLHRRRAELQSASHNGDFSKAGARTAQV